jgi:hypothetical protein
MDAVDRLLRGAVDLHVHPSPSLYPRQIDQVQAAREAEAAGLRAILIKDHHHATAPDLEALRPHLLRQLHLGVFGGVVLNSYVGGLNPYVVDLTLRLGGRMVWFPTISSANHIRHLQADAALKFPDQRAERPETPVAVLDERGEPLPAAREILGQLAAADAAFSPGHLTVEEIFPLLHAARAAGVRRMLVNHPGFMVEATEEQAREFTRLGAYIEHSVAYHHPDHDFCSWPLERLAHWIDAVGPERTILASDLGQRGARNPNPVAGLRDVVGRLLDLGVREADLELMLKRNPAWILGLDD